MRLKPTRSRDAVADALSRLVAGDAWSGSIVELHAGLDAVALPEEREDPTWPRSAAALATLLRSLSDALRDRRLRLSVTPVELLVERLRTVQAAA